MRHEIARNITPSACSPGTSPGSLRCCLWSILHSGLYKGRSHFLAKRALWNGLRKLSLRCAAICGLLWKRRPGIFVRAPQLTHTPTFMSNVGIGWLAEAAASSNATPPCVCLFLMGLHGFRLLWPRQSRLAQPRSRCALPHHLLCRCCEPRPT